MSGGYFLFGKSEKWLAGSAFFVEKMKNGWRVVSFLWKKSKMVGGECLFGKMELLKDIMAIYGCMETK